MQLIVETGEGLLYANSYINSADIEKYMLSNVMVKWNELSADEQIDRLIIASLFIDYSFDWIGQRKTLEQGMNWPRINVTFQGHTISDNYIPLQIKKACIMAVNLVMEFGIDFLQEKGEAQIKKEKLGIIETEYFEMLKSQSEFNSQFADINNMLRGFYKKSCTGGMVTAEVLRK